MADDKFPCRRSESMVATSSDSVMSRPPAISFSPFQKASSKLTLVLCSAMTLERLTTGDFIDRLPLSGVARVPDGLSSHARTRVPVQPFRDRTGSGFQLLAA